MKLQLLEQYYRQPPTYRQVRGGVFALKQRFPTLCRVFSIGRSVLGRDLCAISIGQTEDTTLVVGGIHAQEWITTLLVLRLLDGLLCGISQERPFADVDVKKVLEHRGLILIPSFNPDGIEIALKGPPGALYMADRVEAVQQASANPWQANARGVDLNRNFDINWEMLHAQEQQSGIATPMPSGYSGPRAASEPETRALCAFCNVFPIRQAYLLRAPGEEIDFCSGKYTPARSRLMAQLLAATSGYRLAPPNKQESSSNFQDWFINKLGRPAFSTAVGKGNCPLPVDTLPAIYARLQELFALALLI